MTQSRAELLLVLTTVLWAGTFVLQKIALGEVQPAEFVFLRFASATLISALIWYKSLYTLRGKHALRSMVISLLFASGFILQTFGLTMTSATASAFITGTMVVWVPLVNLMIGGKKLTRLHACCIVLVLVGLWIFTQPDFSHLNGGDLLTLASAFLWAVYMVFLDRWTSKNTPAESNALVVLQFGVTALCAFALYCLQDSTTAVMPSWGIIAAIAYCSILASVVTTWIQTRFQHYTHPVRAGIIFTIEPLAAALIAVWILHDPFDLQHWIGAIVLCAAILIPDLVHLVGNRRDKTRTS